MPCTPSRPSLSPGSVPLATNAVGGRLRFVERPRAGADVEERVVELRFEGLRSLTETAMDILRPLAPRETNRPGTFVYGTPTGAHGEVTLEGIRSIEASEIQQAVRTLALSAAIGSSEPGRREVLSFGNSLVNRTTNPYFRILIGVGVIALMGFVVVRAFEGGEGVPRIIASVVAVIVIGLAVALIVSGIRRWSWWTKARQEAKRQGVELPDQLKFWN